MADTYQYAGEILEYTNGGAAAIAAGDPVVIGDVIGIALVDIAVAGTGSLAIEGAFEVTKVAAVAWNQGDKLDFDVSVPAFTSGLVGAAGDVTLCGIAAEAAAAAATTGIIKLTPGTGTGT